MTNEHRIAANCTVVGDEDQAEVIRRYPEIGATATLTIRRDNPSTSNHFDWQVCSGSLDLAADADSSVRAVKHFEQEWAVASYVVDFAKDAARGGDLDTVFDEAVEFHRRRFEIQHELRQLGLRMEVSLSSLDGDGHPVMVISTGEMAEPDELTSEVLALALEWSQLESPELAGSRELPSQLVASKRSAGPNADPNLLFLPGTGNLWNCQTMDGKGLRIEPVGRGAAWNWSTSRAWGDGVGSGQASTRETAIEAAYATLIQAGLDLSDLPTHQKSLSAQGLEEAPSVDANNYNTDELLVTTDPEVLIRAALTHATFPEKVNVDWLCASLQAAVEKMDKASTVHDPGGFVLAFPGGSDAEAEELVQTLRHGGNNVVLVDPALAITVFRERELASEALGSEPAIGG